MGASGNPGTPGSAGPGFVIGAITKNILSHRAKSPSNKRFVRFVSDLPHGTCHSVVCVLRRFTNSRLDVNSKEHRE